MLFSNKVFDCFLFFNEIKMLQFRIDELYDSIDYFVLVEATKSFTGQYKELFYQNNSHLFKKYHKKIIHIVVKDLQPNIDPWDNEKKQRNHIRFGLKKARLNDLILISDVDEIPDKTQISSIKDKIQNHDFVALVQDMYYYNLNNYVSQWRAARALTYKSYKQFNEDAHHIRFMDMTSVKSCWQKKGGWHLSYFGGAQTILEKINNFSHQEFNNATITKDDVQSCIDAKKDIFNRLPNKIASDCKSNIFSDSNNLYMPSKINTLKRLFNLEISSSELVNLVVSWGHPRKPVEWGSMPEHILRTLKNFCKGNGLQIGGFVGIAHCYLALELEKKGGSICTIDPNLTHNGIENPLLIANKLSSHLELKNSMFILGYAEEQMKILISHDLQYDFIIIDGNHDIQAVESEILLADKLLKNQGYLIMDDINSWQGPMTVYKNFTLPYKKIVNLDPRIGILQKTL